jgi:hypothetical protein
LLVFLPEGGITEAYTRSIHKSLVARVRATKNSCNLQKFHRQDVHRQTLLKAKPKRCPLDVILVADMSEVDDRLPEDARVFNAISAPVWISTYEPEKV